MSADSLEPAACNLCGRDDFSVLYDSPILPERRGDPGTFIASTDRFDRYGRIVRCRNCGLVYTNPRPPERALREGYSQAVDEDYIQEDASRGINAHMSLHVIKKFAHGGAVLDVGCSTGYFLNAARLDFAAHGLEPSHWAAKFARDKLNLDVREGTLEDQAFPPAHFDVVTLIDVIEHLPDPLGALKAAHRLLKPGGVLYIVTPNIRSLSAMILRGKWWGLRPGHIHYFSPKTLAAMLEKSGFETLRLGSYGRMFTYGYWLSRLKNYPRWVRAAPAALIRLLGIEGKFLYLNTRDSMEVCARKS